MTNNDDDYCVLLHIIEGINLNIKGDAIVLNATLNGVKFEVEGLNSEATTGTVFNSNLIWESNFDNIKRMKTDNRPIKVELFTKSPKNVRKPIGFVLLPIRGLQTVTSIRSAQIKLHWHKLGGVSGEWKAKKPELYLFLMIVKKSLIDSGQFDALLAPKSTESTESIFIRPSETSSMLTTQQGVYIKVLEDERLIQVGNNDSDCDIFIAMLTFKNAKNLEQLINPDDKQSSLFRFHYDLLGTSSSVVLTPKGNGVYGIHEKISISFKTSLKSLKEYFRSIFYIPIDLYYNDSIIGNYRFDFSPLLTIETLEEFLSLSTDNVYESNGSFLIETVFDVFASSAKPSVDYVFSLKYLSSSRAKKCEIIHDRPQIVEYIDKNAGGDMDKTIFELPPTAPLSSTDFDLDMRQIQSDSCLTSVRNTQICEEFDKMAAKEAKSEMIIHKTTPNSPIEPSMDPEMAYKVVDELEDWKHDQMERFLVELKRKEVAHLGHLSAEWEKQKTELQGKLEEKLEQCTQLAESLEEAQRLVMEKGINQLEQERIFEKARYGLDKEYAVKFVEMNEKSRRIADDMEHQLKLQELRYKQLEMEKTAVEKDSEKLKEEIAELKETLHEMRKTFLPREQLAGIFNDMKTQSERLVEMQKSKNFYKEQWAKIVREVHKMKLENLQWQEDELKKCRSFGLKKLIDDEQTELVSDRHELHSIKNALASDSSGESVYSSGG